jgi:hypothetical protein
MTAVDPDDGLRCRRCGGFLTRHYLGGVLRRVECKPCVTAWDGLTDAEAAAEDATWD